MVKWKKIKISDIGKIITGKTPKTTINSYYGGNVLFLTPSDDWSSKYVNKTKKYISEEGKLTVKSSILPPDSICVSCIGTIGKVLITTKETITNQQINSIIVNKNKYDINFIYYAMIELGKAISFYSKNSTIIPIVNKNTFSKFELFCPPLIIQKKIGKLLSYIDNKINLNNHINDNLYKQVKLLYNYWFSQFDFPDENNKPYKSSGGKMILNKKLKCDIPKEWIVDKLSNLCSVVIGGTPSKEKIEYWNGDINWLNSSEISKFPIVKSSLKITNLGIDNSSTKLMPIGTVVLSITGNIRTSILAIESCGNQSIVGVLENNELKYPYIYQFITHLIKKFTIISSGNCQQHINKGIILNTLIIVPKKEILICYYEIIAPLYKKMFQNSLENESLIKLRNFLLPLLINNKATIDD